MQILIPMAGRGSRFQRAGYRAIKPLIEVDGKPMIEHVVNLFSPDCEFLFVCARDHLESTPLESVLRDLAPRSKIAAIEPHKLGPVHSALQVQNLIDERGPVLLSYCDYSALWDFSAFRRYVAEAGCAGCIPCYRGFHPHTLGPNFYAYLQTQGDRVLQIREKQSFTSNRMQEFASAGMYYFKEGRLLKRAFAEAVQNRWQVQGEYFASLPYNGLIAEGHDVRVFELTQFLQWGTPEDLQEYQNWSQHFGETPSSAPLQIPGTLLIPMAGSGERFRRAGYSIPKPLIPVDGVPMIDRVLRSLPRPAQRVLVGPRTLAKEIAARADKPVTLSAPTEGAAATCLAARAQIGDLKAPLMVAACDTAFEWNHEAFQKQLADPSLDFVIWTFRNHPHANRHPEQYAWVAADPHGTVQKLSCKVPLSETPAHDPGVTGTFWFRRAESFFTAAQALIREGQRTRGEFYVDDVIPWLLRSGQRGRIFAVTRFLCFGTPDDLRTYEYWARYFRAIRRVGPAEKAA